jgi:crotonobetainyl-CoA:carnitine CoA-transferase CaiB-like acyl-CoA transferase
LYQRHDTGIGQQVDVSILESNMLITAYPTTVHSYVGAGHAWPMITKDKLGILPCKDGYIGANFLSMAQWELMCSFFGMPELVKDPRFLTKQLILEHLDEAKEVISAKLKDRRKMELFRSAQERRLPFGLVPTTKEVIDSPQHRARGFFEEVDHPVMGRVTMPGAPFKLLESPWQLRSPAPLLGEHNQEVYGERLGYSGEELVRLKQQGVI